MFKQIKFSLFILSCTLDYFFNAFFFSDKYLEKQYKQLKQELSDTKTNLQISKEIIDVFMTKCSDPKLKISEIIKSLNILMTTSIRS